MSALIDMGETSWAAINIVTQTKYWFDVLPKNELSIKGNETLNKIRGCTPKIEIAGSTNTMNATENAGLEKILCRIDTTISGRVT